LDEAPWLQSVIEELLSLGVAEFCVGSGKRSAPIVACLNRYTNVKKWEHFEERSGAFFALARSRATSRPVAMVVTSGTAAGELLPACMEAYYTKTPLVLVTADRPRRFRGTGAPQSAEQAGLFGIYTPTQFDLSAGESLDLSKWDKRSPLQLNIALEEPKGLQEVTPAAFPLPLFQPPKRESPWKDLTGFLSSAKNLFVIVSGLSPHQRQPVASFLQALKAPVYLEGISGLREKASLNLQQISNVGTLLKDAEGFGYPITHILRIGSVPTLRAWRDFEGTSDLEVFSLSEEGFSGLSGRSAAVFDLSQLNPSHAEGYQGSGLPSSWKEADVDIQRQKLELFDRFPQAEQSLIYRLSETIQGQDRLYLGNSLPIREWDLAASASAPSDVYANRGLNGIDGQLSSFFGLACSERTNWGLFGDLTVLYDMVGPWICQQLGDLRFRLVVINNGGGMIFKQVGLDERFLNRHTLSFSGLADLWGWEYCKDLEKIEGQRCLVELTPNEQETDQFFQEMRRAKAKVCR